MTTALEFEARQVFDSAYLKAYAERVPVVWELEGQAHDEATQEAVEAVVVFVLNQPRRPVAVPPPIGIAGPTHDSIPF